MYSRSSLRSLTALLVAGLLTLSLSACDSGGSNEDDDSINNRFSLEITPTGGSSSAAKAPAETIEGFSFFATGQDAETNEQGFGIYMSNEENFGESSAQQGLFGIAVRLSGRPPAGSYSLADVMNNDTGLESGSDFGFILFRSIDSESGAVYFATGGTIELTTSNDDRIEGTIEADAMALDFSSGQSEPTPVTITGSFTARNATTFLGTGYLQQ